MSDAKKHKCRHCGVMTTQPDSECYKAPEIVKVLSFEGSLTLYKDRSVYLFVEQKDGFGSETKGLNLTDVELKGIKKFFDFCIDKK